MNNHNLELIAVTGATGRQGGAVARHLLSKGWGVRALTRDVSKPAAQALQAVGAELFRADNDDRASLDEAFRGTYGVFSVQNFWLPDVGSEGEIRQGKTIADAAKSAGVRHLLYSSVGAAHRGAGQAHFASKYEIEKYIRLLGLPYTILRPSYFMENLNRKRAQIINGTFIGMGLRPEKAIQMIAVDDIGAFAALIFEDRPGFLGQMLELAGDEITEPQIAEVLAKVIGRPVALTAPPMPEGATQTPEQIAMFRFFNGLGYDADISALRKLYPSLKTFEQWLRETGWENAPKLQ